MQDPCYRLAWVLDAAMEKRMLSTQHLAELRRFFAPYDGLVSGKASSKAGSKRPRSKRGGDDDDAESQGAGGVANQILGDAGMILRDIPVFHMIIHQVCLHGHELLKSFFQSLGSLVRSRAIIQGRSCSQSLFLVGNVAWLKVSLIMARVAHPHLFAPGKASRPFQQFCAHCSKLLLSDKR